MLSFHSCSTVSPIAAYSVAGLTLFGVAYDSGLFGTPDGHDHSVVVSITPSTASSALTPNAVVVNNVTGEGVAVVSPKTLGDITLA
jgi:hypothetical protein